MVMKIALFTLSIACLCLCGCSKSRNDQENDQQQFDPLTAPIQEVQALQEKIKAKIKSEEAPFNKRIKEITDKLAGTSGEEQKAYLQAIADNGSLRESVTADLKMQLPSNILMDKYNNLMRGYRNAAPYPESINSYLSTNDFNTITQIVNVLNQISPLDAGTIESEQEKIHTYEQSDRFKKRHQPFKSLY
jgi:septal ring factor EnvC (AmiA/AmiB activator)